MESQDGERLSDILKDFGTLGDDHEEIESLGVGFEDISKQHNNSDFRKTDEFTHLKEKWRFSKELTEQQMSEVKKVLESYNVWSGIGLLNTGEKLRMPFKPEFRDATSIQPPYPMSHEKTQIYDKFVKELEDQGVVEDANIDKYCSPALIVIQKGRPRLVIDYRKINSMCEKDVYPLPRQDEIFPRLQDCEYISLLDFKKAFYQFGLHEDDMSKTTFATRHGGAKRLTRSIMGYLNSPAFCQRIMDRLIKRYRWSSILIYIDDLVIFTRTWEEHLDRLNWVLNEIAKIGLTLDPDKAYIGFKSIDLLGHVVNRFGLATQEKKVKAMMSLPKPENLHDLRSMLGYFGYYRKFVENYAQIVEPLSKLLELCGPKNVPKEARTASVSKDSYKRIVIAKHWGEEQDRAFESIKQALSNATLLSHAYLNDDVRFVLYVDASKIGFGAALHAVIPNLKLPKKLRSSSKHHENESERPVAFLSRVLAKGERTYWPTELELCALVWSLKQIEETVGHRKLLIYTDHQSLVWLFNATDTKAKFNQRLLLWAMYLQTWKSNASVIHRPGRTHLNADTLSRYPILSKTPPELLKYLDINANSPPYTQNVARVVSIELKEEFRDAWIKGYQSDGHWRSLYNKLKENLSSGQTEAQYHNYKIDTNGFIWYNDVNDPSNWKLCVPSCCHKALFNQIHDELGHSGYEKSYERLSRSYHMASMSKRLKAYIRSCQKCLASKSKDRKTGLLQPIAIPNAPCETITMDFISGLPLDEEFDSILTITDKHSKMVTLIAGKTTDSAADVASRWMDSYYSRFGIPRAIISDRDVKFVSALWKTIFQTPELRYPPIDCLQPSNRWTKRANKRHRGGYATNHDRLRRQGSSLGR